MRKIFQIGFNKCGTITLFRFFQRNGVSSIHWDEGQLALRFVQRKREGKDPFFDYKDITFFSDMIHLSDTTILEPYKDLEYIFQHYPDSYFILNTRHVHNWILSRLRHTDMVRRVQNVFGYRNLDEVVSHWRLEWHEHHFRALDFFRQCGGKLLVFDIEFDQPAALVDFLSDDFKLDEQFYSHENKTAMTDTV